MSGIHHNTTIVPIAAVQLLLAKQRETLFPQSGNTPASEIPGDVDSRLPSPSSHVATSTREESVKSAVPTAPQSVAPTATHPRLPVVIKQLSRIHSRRKKKGGSSSSRKRDPVAILGGTLLECTKDGSFETLVADLKAAATHSASRGAKMMKKGSSKGTKRKSVHLDFAPATLAALCNHFFAASFTERSSSSKSANSNKAAASVSLSVGARGTE